MVNSKSYNLIIKTFKNIKPQRRKVIVDKILYYGGFFNLKSDTHIARKSEKLYKKKLESLSKINNHIGAIKLIEEHIRKLTYISEYRCDEFTFYFKSKKIVIRIMKTNKLVQEGRVTYNEYRIEEVISC